MSSNNYNFKTGDFNGDSKTDLIHFVNNDSVVVWLSNGDGTFNAGQPYTPRSLYAMSSNNYNFKTGDFNGDSKTDLIHFVNNDSVVVWLSNGDGTFNAGQPYTPRSLYAMSSNNYNFKTGDFNGDSNMAANYAEDNDSTSYMTISSPNGGESLQAGSSYNLTWTDNIAENVNIDLYKGGNFLTTLFSNTASDGSENWTLPTNLAVGSDYSIKITSVNNGNVYDWSNGNFSVVVVTPPPPVWEKPLDSYTVSSSFGTRTYWDGSQWVTNYHTGIDLAAPSGTRVEAARNGTVVFAGWNNQGYGNLVIIDHGNGLRTYYAHLSSISVGVDTAVNTATEIGKVSR
ncbi:peptidoglycan DD-metalloendopeptidase family protein [Dolichospermum sp. UHCC 0259]|nr:peptidoglycan DD-metalloendopeptidase family protein [Dolichospermum sp. UHCC 0259]